MVHLARGRPAEAIVSFRAAQVLEGCRTCQLYEIGQAFEAMQRTDSALATYESLATIIEPGPFGRDFSLPPAYRRLGELYEARGEGKKAVEYYSKFVELWKDADPSLQPRVAEVRKRIAELSAKER
jgi:tetratricopeptide (TPR) repeat protein